MIARAYSARRWIIPKRQGLRPADARRRENAGSVLRQPYRKSLAKLGIHARQHATEPIGNGLYDARLHRVIRLCANANSASAHVNPVSLRRASSVMG